MFCEHCGKELKKDSLYCKECGKPIQIVPDYNKIEDVITDELTNIMMDGDGVSAETRQQEELKVAESTENMEEESEIQTAAKKKKMNKRTVKLIAGITATSLAIIAAIVVIVIVFLNSNNDKSYSYQMEQGYKAVKSQDYDNAILFFQKAAALDKESSAAYWQLADIYKAQNKEDKWIESLENIIEVDADQTDAFSQLLSIYEKNEDMKSIHALSNKAKTQEAKEILSAYLISKPKFNYQEGTYSEDITLEISAQDSEKIYYTLNGNEATAKSKEYTEPISLQGEGRKKIRAVAVNKNGLTSEEVTADYTIAYTIPSEAAVTPDSGSYSTEEKITITVPAHCTAFYTFDGSVPTTASTAYKEPIPMPIGNNILSVVLVDQDGKMGPVVTKIYNLELTTPVSALNAENLVLDRLIEKKEILDAAGAIEGRGGKCTVKTTNIISIASHQYYIVKKYYEENGIKEEENYTFAVDTSTGDVFQAIPGAQNSYSLNGY